MKKNIVFLFLASTTLCQISLSSPHVLLVFGGKTGWIGQQLVTILKNQGYTAIPAESRLENRESIIKELETIKPDCVINAAGVTGRPNVDWCEDHKQDVLRANILGTLNLADITYQRNLHMIHFGTGCIYEYDANHPMGSLKGFTEEDKPNYAGSYYSYTKAMLDQLLQAYPNVLNLRLRMPISDEFHPRNLIVKITGYKKVVNIQNSMSVLSTLLPLISQMAERNLTGTYNFVNPGVISHNEILDLYKQYVDPTFIYQNFSLEEQTKILKAGRSNNQLDATKLQNEFPFIPDIKTAVKKTMQEMGHKKNVYA